MVEKTEVEDWGVKAALSVVVCLLAVLALAYEGAVLVPRTRSAQLSALQPGVSQGPRPTVPPPAPREEFRDLVTGFTVAKPEGWLMSSRNALREQARNEAQRLGNAGLRPPSEESAGELLVRITRFAPDSAGGPNPAITVVRFDVERLPPGTTESDLLRMGTSDATMQGSPVRVEFGGRPWQTLTATQQVTRQDGLSIEAVQEIYVTLDPEWALGIVISATRDQFAEYRRAFDAVLSGITFKRGSLPTARTGGGTTNDQSH